MAQAGIGNLAGGMGKFTELRQRLLFVVGALIVYRIGCYVPVPGVNPDAMLAMMQQQGGGIVDMFNMFSGGALHRFQHLRAERDAVHLGIDRDAAGRAHLPRPEGDAEGR